MRSIIFVSCLLLLSVEARAQSLEETLATLQGVNPSTLHRVDPSTVENGAGGIRFRTVDAAKCIASSTMPPSQGSNVLGDVLGNIKIGKIVRTYYFNEAIASKTHKDYGENPDDAWIIQGNYGSNVHCDSEDDKNETCSDSAEFLRGPSTLPDYEKQASIIDRAIVHLFADLCKGASQRTPF